MKPRGTRHQRFDRYWIPVTESGCWIWIGTGQRYGQLKVDGRMIKAHRISWELHHGTIPVGMNVLHKCDVTHCVNPDHLFLGTQMDNVRDMTLKNRDHKSSRPGQSNHRAKLTNSQVFFIRSSNKSSLELATQFGVAQSTINTIKRRGTWRHV